ncbi:MAG: zinc-binding dehydrogenase, partial [Clostridia bacterium]|nr:zinc-binding dehydrogenase [Clostridia bacterium]
CTLMCAKLYGPGTVIAIDTSNERLELAKEQGLADVILNPFEQDVEQEIRKLTQGRGADAVLEVAGGRDTFRMAWRIARPNAVVCVVALYEEPQMLPLPDMYGKNLVFKTGGVDASCCEEIMKLIKAGKLDTSCLITHRAKLEDIMKAYDVFENKRDHVIKYAIEVS